MRVSLIFAGCMVIGCGGPRAQDPTTLIGPLALDAGPASTSAAPLPTLLTGARMPPPFALESKHVELKPQALAPACRALGTDPKATLATLAQACALKPEGAPLTGQQEPGKGSMSFELKGVKGQCYRLAAVAQPSVKSLVVTLLDAEGAIAAEYHTDDLAQVLLPSESICFKDDAVLKVLASVGWGSGGFSVQALKE